MEEHHGGTAAEDAAYRAGMVQARIASLETHAASVNGTIRATGEALSALTLSVNELRLTIKMLEISELTGRVDELEKSERADADVRRYKRALVTTAIAAVSASVGFLAYVAHLFH